MAIKTRRELIVPPESDQIDCPFCGDSCAIEYRRPFWVLSRSCSHADMAVDAGAMEIAIQFVGSARNSSE
jgi:hypothetical protein